MTHSTHQTPKTTIDAGHWYSCQVKMPVKFDGAEALRQSDISLQGNLRYALSDDGVLLIGEIRDHFHELTPTEVSQRLFRASPPATEPSAITGLPVPEQTFAETSCMLQETAHEWTLVEPATDDSPSPTTPGQWTCSTSLGGGGTLSLAATVVEGGVEVQALVGELPAAITVVQRAVAHLLARAHRRIRFARYAIRGQHIMAISFASEDRLDVELPDSVAATIASVGNIQREVQALADPRVASAYITYCGADDFTYPMTGESSHD